MTGREGTEFGSFCRSLLLKSHSWGSSQKKENETSQIIQRLKGHRHILLIYHCAKHRIFFKRSRCNSFRKLYRMNRKYLVDASFLEPAGKHVYRKMMVLKVETRIKLCMKKDKFEIINIEVSFPKHDQRERERKKN